jgi:two-component system cell cycle response regulator
LASEAVRPPSVEGARALVVDDWEPTARTLQEGLAREGIAADRAAGSVDALALAEEGQFDLIVLSLSLRSIDPLQLASHLRATDRAHGVPMLLIADPEQKARTLRGFDLGANDWLLRPVDVNELRVRARNQIRRKFYQDHLHADFGRALELALTDPLTGFYNQRYLMRHLRGLLENAGAGSVAVMMIDVDHFKEINDRWGHRAGDAALQAIAEALRRRIRVFDSIARYGGEEFAVVMRGTTEVEAVGAAERLRNAVAETLFEPEPGVVHPMAVSIGISCSEGREISAEQLLAAADQALYRAKRCGRNRAELTGVS